MKKIIFKSLYFAGCTIAILAIAVVLLETLTVYKPSDTIHTSAPVKTKQFIVIGAPVEKVWQVFTDVNRWSEWQKEITSASLDAPFQRGSVIKWETNGFKIQSQLQNVQHEQKLAWAGKAFGSFAIHTWTFERHNGFTTVIVEESMEGWLVWLMQDYVQKNLYTATEYWLAALKKESE